VAAPARAQNDRCINDVACAADTAELACSAGTNVVQRFDLHLGRAQQASQSRLSTSVPPDLTDDTGRHRQRHTLLNRARDDRYD